MNTSKTVGLLLMVVSLGLGYIGFTTIADNHAELDLSVIQIDISDKKGKEQGYIYLGIAAVLLGAGAFLASRKGN